MALPPLVNPNEGEIEFQIGRDAEGNHTALCTLCLTSARSPYQIDIFAFMEKHRAEHFGQLIEKA